MKYEISKESLQLFNELLGQVAVKADNPEFDLVAARISAARKELIQLLTPQVTPEEVDPKNVKGKTAKE